MDFARRRTSLSSREKKSMRTVSVLSHPRRVRNLAISLAVLLLGASFYAHNVQADEGCGAQADFLVKSDPLQAPVQPADCARLFDRVPAFAWPQAHGTDFVVTVTYPDGRTATAEAAGNWLSWGEALPPGDYSWTVSTAGARSSTSMARRFTVDRAASSS